MSASELRQIVARNIQKLLDMNGMSRAELSRRLDVSRSTISNWCNGELMPRAKYIEDMCRIFRCSRSDILGEQTSSMKRHADWIMAHPEYEPLMLAIESGSKEDMNILIAFIEKWIKK